ncbi:hypothetical protein GCM10009759_69000 [Kitasatospora saccharophila]|uniref:TetR family transcriptional regulator n=2 Tax=Kitasatospora saccharophila TaxID=407973 RepID=A0ABN2Y0Y2_9ACTN
MTTRQDPDGDAGLPSVTFASMTAAAVEALVEETIEAVVAAPAAESMLGLVDVLDQAGVLWQGAMALLGPAASRPLAGLGELEAVARLRKLADTPDLVSSLNHTVSAEFRERGAAAAREVWEAAGADLRRGTLAQLLVGYCHSIGGEAGTLSAKDLVRLLHQVVPVTW